jgi:cell division protein FtsB
VLVYADINVYKNKIKLAEQIKEYKSQIKNLEEKNYNLKQGISQADDNSYIEKVAREDLDLQKPGETVVGFIMPKIPAAVVSPEEKNFLQNIWNKFLKIFK